MYQFIHIETYALKASSKVKPTSKKQGSGKIKYSASHIIDEALREVKACPHVDNPMPPKFVLGSEDDMRNLIPRINDAVSKFKNPDGRKLRSDAHVLLAGVASYPREAEQDNPEAYQKWKSSTVDFLKSKYGDKLSVVLEHQDEAHPHLHFYCIDEQSPNVKMLHDGYAAASKHPQLSKESGLAYKAAMREFQNAYYQDVGVSTGLTRMGPGRKRLSRVEWNSQKAEAQQIAKAYVATSEIVNEATLQGQSIVNEARQERIKLEQERRDFEVEQATFYEKKRELIAAMKKAKEFQAQLYAVEVIQKTRHEMLLAHEREYQSKVRLTDELRLRLTDEFLRENGIPLESDMTDVDFTQSTDWTVGCDPTQSPAPPWYRIDNDLKI